MKPWRERIAEARARGEFTTEDMTLATRSWCTCAVGEQLALYGEEVVMFLEGGPADPTLWRLGASRTPGFGQAVERNDFDAAERLLDAIEDRALELKRERAI